MREDGLFEVIPGYFMIKRYPTPDSVEMESPQSGNCSSFFLSWAIKTRRY
jgi:hypothetical protein